jgi:hypothetical protein
MGASQSSQISQTTEIINQSMTNLTQNNTNSASAKNANANSFYITIGEKGDVDCPIDFSQSIRAEQKVKVMAKFKNLADLQTQMKAALANTIDQQQELKQQSLATTIGVQNSKQAINQKIQNIVNNSITNSVLNEVNAFLDNVNKGKLEIKGKYKCTGGKIKIDQNIASEQVAELLADTLMENITSTSADSAASAESKQSQKTEQTGIIGDLGAFFGNIWVIMILVFVVIGAFVYKFRVPIMAFIKMTPVGRLLAKTEVSKFGKSKNNKKILGILKKM